MESNALFQDCELAFTPTSFCVHAPTAAIAKSLKQAIGTMAMQALKLGKQDTQIFYPACKRPYQIPAKMALNEMASAGSRSPASRDENTRPMSDLLGADYVRLHEFLIEQRQRGMIVIITSNTSDRCIHTNDLLLPSRSTWEPHQFNNYNYLKSWRRDRNDLSDNPVPSEDYETLKRLLETDGQISGYKYRLYRPDGAFCEYSTDYFLVKNYCNDQVRIGVSHPEQWRVLQPA